MVYKGITLLQIEYFIAVAKSLNFTEAAKSLYVSQPTLSKQIAMLERGIGVQLFNRTTRGVRVTPAGVVLYKELGDVSEIILKAIEKATQSNLGEKGYITIGCPDSMDTSLFLPEIVTEFEGNHKGIKFIYERHSFKKLRERFVNGNIDVMLTLSFEIDVSLDVEYETIYKIPSCIVMSTSNPLAKREKLVLHDVKDEDFVTISRDESPRGFDSITALCLQHGFTPNIVKQLPNSESMMMCVNSGLGVTVIDSNIRLPNNAKIKLFPIDDDIISIVVAWKKDNMNPTVALFTNSIVNRGLIKK